jgi:hypothetical protein
VLHPLLLGFLAGLGLGLLCLGVTLLILRKTVLGAKAKEEMCKELVSDLARSERDRKILLKGFLDACDELEELHAEKRANWGIPDEM